MLKKVTRKGRKNKTQALCQTKKHLHAFEEHPSPEKKQNSATELFSFFTADIIKEEIVFTR